MCLKQLEGDYLKVEITHENIGDAHNEQGHDEEAKKNMIVFWRFMFKALAWNMFMLHSLE